jgi:hypothetical protein
MADGWTAEVIARFEEALAPLSADNGKAIRLAVRLHQAATLEEKLRAVAAWRMLAAHIVSEEGVMATPKDLPHWFSLAALLEDWARREGAPLPAVGDSLSE